MKVLLLAYYASADVSSYSRRAAEKCYPDRYSILTLAHIAIAQPENAT